MMSPLSKDTAFKNDKKMTRELGVPYSHPSCLAQADGVALASTDLATPFKLLKTWNGLLELFVNSKKIKK